MVFLALQYQNRIIWLGALPKITVKPRFYASKPLHVHNDRQYHGFAFGFLVQEF